jgi:hypothetical protein
MAAAATATCCGGSSRSRSSEWMPKPHRATDSEGIEPDSIEPPATGTFATSTGYV